MANQIYCKHCGKLIDADSSFCMHCGSEINSNSKITPQANKQDVSFIRQLDILGGKFIKRHWKRILIFILGIAVAILLIYLLCKAFEGSYRAMFIMPAIILIIWTLYYTCSEYIKLILPSSILLLCSYGIFIYDDHQWMYGANTTFFDTVKREFCWITPNYTIPDHATSIGEMAFASCDGLTSITIPNSVTVIGYRAFYNCNDLTSITISDSVTSIGEDTVCDCDSLTGFTTITLLDGRAFYDCDNLTRVNVNISDLARYCTSNPMHRIPGEKHLYLNGKEITNLVIPNSVTTIENSAFEDCKSLTSITIPNSVTSIGERAFQYCESLASVTIPNSLTEIGDYAFHKCSHLTSVTIGNSVTEIGDYAFDGCDGLTSITIPNSVTKIGHGAFEDCTWLTSVYCKATTPPTGDSKMFSLSNNRFTNIYKPIGCKIYVPRNSVEAYKKAWSYYASNIVGYDF